MAENAKTTLEERLARVEGVLEQMNERLNHLESKVNGLRGELAQLRAEFHTDFRWLIGFVVGTWITLMLTLIFKP